MTRTAPVSSTPSPGLPTAVRVGPELALAAAVRLVSQQLPERELAARKFLATAPSHRIDISLMWATVKPRRPGRRTPGVGQVCLLVPGHGRTAMLFLSEPDPADAASEQTGLANSERIACITAAREHVAAHLSESIKLLQGLPSPNESWSVNAFEGAGFSRAGQLSYIRTALPHPAQALPMGAWPAGVEVVSVKELAQSRGIGERSPEIDRILIKALERSYIDTLDCPELCGLRETGDVLESHRSTGVCDPSLWFVVLFQGEPAGCMLLSRCPEQHCVELVYLGIGPELRGKGLGKLLMQFGVRALAKVSEPELCCAVDLRNTAALRLYGSLGFLPFSERVALVKKP